MCLTNHFDTAINTRVCPKSPKNQGRTVGVYLWVPRHGSATNSMCGLGKITPLSPFWYISFVKWGRRVWQIVIQGSFQLGHFMVYRTIANGVYQLRAARRGLMLSRGLRISGMLPEAMRKGAGSKKVWLILFQVYIGWFPQRKKPVIWRVFVFVLDQEASQGTWGLFWWLVTRFS